MPPNRNEPATKFYGPNYPFVISSPPSLVIVQLHNLKIGQHWRPALAALIQSSQVLLPQVGQFTWLKVVWPFAWRWRHRLNEISLIVDELVTPSPVFAITLNFLETRWMLNEITTAPGNYSFAGTATLQWKDVPRS